MQAIVLSLPFTAVPSRVELLLAPTAADDTAVIYLWGDGSSQGCATVTLPALRELHVGAIEMLDARDDDVMLGTPALPRLRALHRAETPASALASAWSCSRAFRWTQCSRRF